MPPCSTTAGKRVLVTTDLLLEGVHFDLTYVPLKHLGYKSAVVNFSDIYAMNGTPRQITVSLGVSKRFSVENLEEPSTPAYNSPATSTASTWWGATPRPR